MCSCLSLEAGKKSVGSSTIDYEFRQSYTNAALPTQGKATRRLPKTKKLHRVSINKNLTNPTNSAEKEEKSKSKRKKTSKEKGERDQRKKMKNDDGSIRRFVTLPSFLRRSSMTGRGRDGPTIGETETESSETSSRSRILQRVSNGGACGGNNKTVPPKFSLLTVESQGVSIPKSGFDGKWKHKSKVGAGKVLAKWSALVVMDSSDYLGGVVEKSNGMSTGMSKGGNSFAQTNSKERWKGKAFSSADQLSKSGGAKSFKAQSGSGLRVPQVPYPKTLLLKKKGGVPKSKV